MNAMKKIQLSFWQLLCKKMVIETLKSNHIVPGFTVPHSHDTAGQKKNVAEKVLNVANYGTDFGESLLPT